MVLQFDRGLQSGDGICKPASFGMSIAEFPTTIAAAQALHAGGARVLMGAPNLVRGGSHSGNVATAELARAGVLDVSSWPLPRLMWLTITALVLVIASLLALAEFGGSPPGSTYVPAHLENGRLVPGAEK